jgi:hypothetical protein
MTPAERRRQLVQGYRASRQTMAAFARRERINYATFAGWVAKASREPGAHPPLKFAEHALPNASPLALPAGVLEERPTAANLVLRLIARLYGLERDWEEAKFGEARAALRREKFARPLRGLRQVVTGLARQALPQSLLSKACSYLPKPRKVLVAQKDHSPTRIDHNLVENAIQPAPIGKKL